MADPVLKHKKVTPYADGSDASAVQPSNWNDDHDTAALFAWLHAQFPQTSVYFKYVSGGQCLLAPEGGGSIWINGVNRKVDAGSTLVPSGLTVSTAYMVYAYWDATANSGAGGVRLATSTTGFTKNATTGIPQLTGDVTRTLVGRVICGAGPAFVQTASVHGVSSYWNRKDRTAVGTTAATWTFGTSTPTILPGCQVSWFDWGEETVSARAANVYSNDTEAISYSTIFLNGAQWSVAHYGNIGPGRFNTQLPHIDANTLASAFNSADVRCYVSGGTMSSYTGAQFYIGYRG